MQQDKNCRYVPECNSGVCRENRGGSANRRSQDLCGSSNDRGGLCGLGIDRNNTNNCECGSTKDRCGINGCRRNDDNSCEIDNCTKMMLGMAYVRSQPFENLYEPAKAWTRGTLFCDLDLPYGGGRK